MDIALLIVLIVALVVALIRMLPERQSLHIRDSAGSTYKRRTQALVSSKRISYKSVSIVCDSSACEAAESLMDKQFLTHEAPVVPLPDCTSTHCECKYIHHQDRRKQTIDRRAPVALNTDTSEQSDRSDRRCNNGRRRSDWKYA